MRYPCAMETLYLSHETAWWYWQNAKRAATTLAVSSRTCVLRDAAHTSQAAARIVGQGFFACEHLAVMVSEAGTHSTPHVSFHCTKSPLLNCLPFLGHKKWEVFLCHQISGSNTTKA